MLLEAIYLTRDTHPDMAYSLTDMSQFNEKHCEEYWKGMKHIFRYLKGTQYRKLKFQKTGKFLEVYSVADGMIELTVNLTVGI